MDTWEMLDAERTEFADLCDTLTPEQWDTRSLCAKWRVRDVVGHVARRREPEHGSADGHAGSLRIPAGADARGHGDRGGQRADRAAGSGDAGDHRRCARRRRA